MRDLNYILNLETKSGDKTSVNIFDVTNIPAIGSRVYVGPCGNSDVQDFFGIGSDLVDEYRKKFQGTYTVKDVVQNLGTSHVFGGVSYRNVSDVYVIKDE